MTELEKEVEEHLENNYCKNVCTCDEIEECKNGIRIRCMSFNHKKELIVNFAKSKEERIGELKKENAELHSKVGLYQVGMANENNKRDILITRAKEIIRYLLDFIHKEGYRTRWDIDIKEAEDFIKESE